MKFLLLLLNLMVWLASSQPPAKNPTTPLAPRNPLGVRPAPAKPALSDTEIERAFLARLAKSKIGPNNVRIRVSNGVATLEGRVNVLQHKGAATRMAKSAGARHVINRIELSDPARQKASQQMQRARKAQLKGE
ncbi:MAG: BON domain-containing protein [Bryobacteraceae bacterium]|nr:BON domain-containing protein [Bryobacteraceae bacterium]MDW8378121.1 BON domain-containing protein [Bryobacterales bacterium]